MRGDITTNKGVRAFCAFEGRTTATKADLERIAPLVLNHRWVGWVDGCWGCWGGGGAGAGRVPHGV